jgi:hypothetical protein
MKKNTVLVLVALSITALGLTLIPHVSSQVEDAQVLSYSAYMHPFYTNVLVIVGEVQNTGSNIIDQIVVTGTFYAPDGTIYMQNSVQTLTTQILPQQKSPFYLMFSPSNIVLGTNWTSQDVTDYNITVAVANPTEARQYQDLTIIDQSASTDNYGYYYVAGTVKNTGTESTNATWVVATFYNSTGSVVAVGYTETVLTPTSIAPGETADFVIYPADYTSAGDIASYALISHPRLTASSTPTPTPTPSATPSASPTPTPSSSASPTPTPSGNGTAIPDTYVYVAAIVVVIVVVGVVVLALRKRAGKRTAISKEQAE